MSEARMEAPAQGCIDCVRDWWHCHGTWVAHADGGECSEDVCDVPAEAHVFVIPCREIGNCCE